MQKGIKLDAKAVEESIRRIHPVYPGQILDPSDQELFRTVLRLQYGLITDLRLADPSAKYRWFTFLKEDTIDVLRYSRSMKFLAQFCLDYLDISMRNLCEDPYWSRLSLSGFKHLITSQSLYWGCMAPLISELVQLLDGSFTDQTIFAIRQWACLSSRVNFRSLDLTETCEEQYKLAEQQMQNWDYCPETLSNLNSIVREWFSDFRPNYLTSRHGPGSVSQTHGGRLHKSVKNCLCKTDLRLDYLLARRDWLFIPLESGLSRVSELVCVPKSMETNRTISREPVSLQYFQQGLFHCMNEYFQRQDWLRRVIQLDDQEKSKRLARQGSEFGHLATIDLSNASDSVTLTLVKGLFAGTPLYADLICTRSDATTLPSGEVLRLEKFAPMGSAVCFPIECIVFSSICELAAREIRGRARSTHPEYRVYGDDIVVRSDIAERVIQILTDLHFTVNRSKSFWHTLPHNFREACGGEYLDGVDITPLRISRWFHFDPGPTMLSVEAVASFVELCNNSFRRGYCECRRLLMIVGRAMFPQWDLLFYIDREDPSRTDEPGSLLTPALLTYPDCRTNYRLKSRWNRWLFRTEYLALVPEGVDDIRTMSRDIGRLGLSSSQVEDGRYLGYWHSRTIYPIYRVDCGVVITPESENPYPVRLRWRTKWVAE